MSAETDLSGSWLAASFAVNNTWVEGLQEIPCVSLFMSVYSDMNTHKHVIMSVYIHKHGPRYAFICIYVRVYLQTCTHVYNYIYIYICLGIFHIGKFNEKGIY